jgi:hypothetical protein
MKMWLYCCLLVGLMLSGYGCSVTTTHNVLAQDAADHRAQLSILQADLDVIQKQKELANVAMTATPEARAVAEQNLRRAQLKANSAYQGAGLAAPYPEARLR